jgi:PAS domain S-box-containing protein
VVEGQSERDRGTGAAPGPNDAPQAQRAASRAFSWTLAAVFVLAIVSVVAIALAVYEREAGATRTQKAAELKAVASLKAGQVANWLVAQRGNAEAASYNHLLAVGVRRWVQSGTPAGMGSEITQYLAFLALELQYRSVMLVGPTFRMLAAAPASAVQDLRALRPAMGRAQRTGQVEFLDLHRDASGTVVMDFVAPLLESGGANRAPGSTVVFEIDPRTFLFPTIGEWPSPSRSAETVLVRRMGAEVVYLSPLRHGAGAPLSRRVPLTRRDVPAVRAVLGHSGIMEGRDYRGVPVLADLRRVPGSPWFIVAKVDQAEVYAGVRRLAWLTVGVIIGVLVILGLGAALAWRRHEAGELRRLFAAELERKVLTRHYEHVMRHANDIIVLTDEHLRITEVNQRAVEKLGYAPDEIIGMPVDALRAPEDPVDAEALAERIRSEGGAVWETTYVAKDGTRIPVEVSSGAVDVEGTLFFEAIIRDLTERRRAEAMIDAFFTGSPVGLAIVDADFRFVSVNERLADINGVPVEGHLGRTLREVVPDVADAIEPAWTKVMQTGVPVVMEEVSTETPREPGVQRFFLASYFPIAGVDGRPEYLGATVVEVTEARRAEEAVRQSEERFRALVELGPDGVAVHSEGQVVFANSAIARLLGYDSPDEMIGRPVMDFVAPSSRKVVAERVGRMTEAGVRVPALEERFLRADGSEVDVEVVAAPFVFDGRTAIQVIIRDITERRQTAAQLALNMARLRLVTEIDRAILAAESPKAIAAAALAHIYRTVPCGRASIAVLDSESDDGEVLAVVSERRAGLRTTGRMTVLMSGQRERLERGEVILVDDLAAASDTVPIQQTLAARGLVAVVRVPLLVGSQLTGVLSLAARDTSSFTGESLEFLRTVAAQMALALEQARLREQADRYAEELEERVAERTAQLESANRELEAFAYSVSHDLRAPLRALDGFSLAVLEDHGDRLDEESRDHLQRVRAAAQRMGLLIDDLLELSRVARLEMEPERVDLSALAAEVGAELAAEAPERDLEFVVAAGAVAHGDPRLLRIVMSNLVGNAVKFTARRDHGRIEFGEMDEDGHAVYFVRDNGAGFDQTYADRLFAPFQRLHAAEEFPGTGIGLATVQRIVHRHGGTVRAEGDVEKGATFYFTLGRGPSRPVARKRGLSAPRRRAVRRRGSSAPPRHT